MTAIVDYDTGNLRSVADAMRRIGAEFTITAYPALLRGADRVLLPGVGEASSAMAKLRERGLDLVIPTLTQPVLGICIGMQLLCLDSEEGDARCLGIFPAHVRRLKPAENGLKIPHVGWNTVGGLRGTLLEGIDEETYVYYVLVCGGGLRSDDRPHRLRRGVQRRAGPRQLFRHAVPPRKERFGGRKDPAQLFKTVTR